MSHLFHNTHISQKNTHISQKNTHISQHTYFTTHIFHKKTHIFHNTLTSQHIYRHNHRIYQAVTRAVNLLFRGRESASDDSPSPDESDQSFSRQVRQRVDSPASDIFDIEKALTSNGVGSQGVRLTHGNYVYNLTRHPSLSPLSSSLSSLLLHFTST